MNSTNMQSKHVYSNFASIFTRFRDIAAFDPQNANPPL